MRSEKKIEMSACEGLNNDLPKTLVEALLACVVSKCHIVVTKNK